MRILTILLFVVSACGTLRPPPTPSSPPPNAEGIGPVCGISTSPGVACHLH